MTTFAPELRRLRTEAGMSQRDLAALLEVKREIISQWENGKFLPATVKVTKIDEALRADGTLIEIARRERGSGAERLSLPGQRPPLRTEVAGAGVSVVFDRLTAALRAGVVTDPRDAGLVGWAHTIGGDRPTPWSTALGLRTLQLLDAHHDLDVAPLLQVIARRQEKDGGWANRVLSYRETSDGAVREEGVSRPEPTAVALDVLTRVGGGGADLERAWAWLETSLSDQDRARPYVVSAVLGCVAEIRPSSPLLETLTTDLVGMADADGLWSANPEAAPFAEPSIAHTGRAVRALRAVARVSDRADVRTAIDGGLAAIAAWDQGFDGVTEQMRPDPRHRQLDVPVDHFSAAHVLSALAGTDVTISQSQLRSIWDVFWASYRSATGVWIWKADGRVPLWMALDAVRALRHCTLAQFPPIPTPPLPGVTVDDFPGPRRSQTDRTRP